MVFFCHWFTTHFYGFFFWFDDWLTGMNWKDFFLIRWTLQSLGCYAQRFGARGYGHLGISSMGLTSDILDSERQRYLCPIVLVFVYLSTILTTEFFFICLLICFLSTVIKLQKPQSLIQVSSKHVLVRDAPVAVVLYSLPKRFCPRAANGTGNASSVTLVHRLWIQSMLVMVLTRMFTVRLAMARTGVHMDMDSLVDLVSYKLMAWREYFISCSFCCSNIDACFKYVNYFMAFFPEFYLASLNYGSVYRQHLLLWILISKLFFAKLLSPKRRSSFLGWHFDFSYIFNYISFFSLHFFLNLLLKIYY